MDLKELESFKLSDAVKFHNTLNPALWSEKGKIDPEVRSQLLEIARDFMSELGISSTKVEDITISGSNAAYSYTPHSDLDLHILVDFSKLSDDEIYRELFQAKKTLYNDSHDIKVHGVPVELYVQDANEPVQSLGEFSILKNEWIKIPKKRRANFDQAATKLKYEKIGNLAELALKSGSLKKVEKVLNTIKRYRKAGLDKTGEFGPENLAFKALRSQGYIKKLYDLKNKLHSIDLSIAENKLLDKPTMTPKQIAKKHGVSVNRINSQLNTGIKVEKEHTSSTTTAREIALDHLGENPNYYTKLKKANLEEGGWTTGDNPGIKAKLVKKGISAVNSFLKDFNPWLKKQGLGPVSVGHPTGSAAYHELDDPENTIYGDMDLQVIVPDRPEYEEMTSGQIQGLWGRLMDAFIAEKNPSYIDKSESKISQPMFVLKDGTKMQVDIMPHPVKTSEWGRYRATGEHGLKGLLNGNIFATMSELLPINLQHKGLQYKAIDGKKVDYTKTRKGYTLHTVTTDIKSWILDLFLHEAKEIGVKRPKIDKLLRNNPGVDVNNVNVERQVNGIKGFANSCEMNDMFGKGDLAAFSSANDFLYQFINHYVDKSEHAISAPKRDKASTPASQARAVKDREALSKGLEYVKKLFSGEVFGQRYKDYQQIQEDSDDLEYQGNCTEDDIIEHIFGDVNNFARMVEEYGDEFEVDHLVVKYNPDEDIHYFYYKKQGVTEGQGNQMSKTKALNALRRELMKSYDYMKCKNLQEFNQRLQWLSEGMLENHMTGGRITAINQKEIKLYKEFCEKREQIKRSFTDQGLAEGFEHSKQDLSDVAEWMNTTPNKLSITVKQEPIEKFIKQIREMYGTYDEFPEDEERTNRILKLLNRGAKPMPMYVEANDPDLFVMEGRHRMVAFWLAGMKTIPVAYVGTKDMQSVSESKTDIPSILYHATYRPLLQSIKKNGLGGVGSEKKKWEDSIHGVVYLGLDPHVAESYAETSDAVPDEWLDNIVILKISTNGLDTDKFNVDKNVLDNEGDTLEYHGVIPVSNISIYKKNITETFDKPYSIRWEESEYGDHDALATLEDGTYLRIMFNKQSDDEYEVAFHRNYSLAVTGEGDAHRIFATVLKAIHEFIQKENPWRLIFSASKEANPGQNSDSRAKLYNTLIARYARAWGYDEYNEDHGDQITYELTRIKKQKEVSENITKVDGGWSHTGTGHRMDMETGKYPVYPLPRFNTFSNYHRNKEGSYKDILHYMYFTLGDWQTINMDLTGDEIVDTMTNLYGTNSVKELKDLNKEYKSKYKSWNEVYTKLKKKQEQKLSQAFAVRESASGYIPSKKEANDPRFKTALTVDVKPDTIQKNAKAFGFKVSRAGIPPLLRK